MEQRVGMLTWVADTGEAPVATYYEHSTKLPDYIKVMGLVV